MVTVDYQLGSHWTPLGRMRVNDKDDDLDDNDDDNDNEEITFY